MTETISPYLLSWRKRAFDVVVGGILLAIALPIMGLIGILVLVTEGWPIFFVQDRVGRNGKVFRMYKLRTMRVGAEKEQDKFRKLNEADGPVFKIRNDPRFVGLGRWLSHTGLDELPQLINVLKGGMSLVGPRPLPVYEVKMLNKRSRIREIVLPGIISLWVVNGSHALPFDEWMRLDDRYIRQASFKMDLVVIGKTWRMIFGMIVKSARQISALIFS